MKKIIRLALLLISLLTVFSLVSCEKTYDVLFELNGGTMEEDIEMTCELGEVYTLPKPVKEGFVFEGWYRNSDFTGSSMSVLKISDAEDAKNVILYAKYRPIVFYEVTYELNGGMITGNSVVRVEENTEFNLPVPTKSGHRFLGWYESESFSGAKYESLRVTKNTTLYAKFEPIIYHDVVLELNGGIINCETSLRIEEGTEFTLPTPTKSGYAFMGWYKTSDFTGNPTAASISVDENINLYAKYYVAYSITYNMMGGINNSSNPAYYTSEEGAVLLDPTREGFEFLGWKDEDGQYISNNVIPKGSSGERTFVAEWKEIIHYRDLHSSISWESSIVFDMSSDVNTYVGKIIKIPETVKTIRLIGNYDVNPTHVYTELSFVIQPRSTSIEFILENFAFTSYGNTPAISANGIDVIIVSNGNSNAINGSNGINGTPGKSGTDHNKTPTSGKAGTDGTNGTCAVTCKNLKVCGPGTITFVGGSGGVGGNGGKGGNIPQTGYTGVPTCGHGGRGGNGGDGAYSIIVTGLNVEGEDVRFISGSGGAGGRGGNGGNGTFNLINFCYGGDAGNGGDGGDTHAAISVGTDISARTYSATQGSVGSAGWAGSAGKGNGNNFWSAVDNMYGDPGQDGNPGRVV